MISSECGNFEKGETFDAGQLGRVGDSYFYDLTRADLAASVVHLNRRILPVVLHFLYCVAGGDLRGVLEVENLSGGLANEKVLEVKAGLVQRDEWVLSECAHLQHFRQLATSFHHFENERGDNDLSLFCDEADLNFCLLLGAQGT